MASSPAPLPDEEPRRSPIELAVDRPVAVTMVVLAVAVFGWVSFSKLSLTLLPRISYPALTVRTEFEGAAPAEIEELVTEVLESNLAVTSGLDSFRSISRAGVSDIILEFGWDVDMSFAAQDVREKVDQVRGLLPREVGKPLLLKYDPTLDPVIRLGLWGGDLERMRFYAEERLKRRLESVGGVAAVRVKGGLESEIRIDLDEDELARARVSVADIERRLSEENVNVASGILREGDVEYLVRTLNQFRDLEEIGDLVVATRDGALIRLRDVARVRQATKERDVATRINGRPSVEIAIYKEDAANVVDVAHAVKAEIFGAAWRTTPLDAELDATTADGPPSPGGAAEGADARARRTLADERPPGARVRLLSDQSRFIERSIEEVQDAGLFGAAIAVLVLFVFLRRAAPTAIIAVAIPISVVATFGPMLLFDVSLNVMSLGGLALGIGMLVDASIVVLESIDRCRREGLRAREAAIEGTRQVASAVFASVLTTVAVFLPIVFVRGVAGEIFGDQSLTVVFSLLASLIVALFFIPMLAARQPSETDPVVGPRERLRRLGAALAHRAAPPPRRWQAVRTVLAVVAWTRRGGLFRKVPAIAALPALLAYVLIQGIFEAAARLLWGLVLVIMIAVFAIFAAVRAALGAILAPGLFVFDRFWSGLEAAYGLVLRGALAVRPAVVLAAAALVAAAWFTLPAVGLELIPELHGGEIIVEAPQPVGSSLETTERVVGEIERRIEAARARGDLDILGHSSTVGVARDEIAPAGEGPHTARIHVLLPPGPDLAAAERDVADRLRAELADVPEIQELAFSTPRLFSFDDPLEVQVRGDDLTRIEAIGRRIAERMREDGAFDDVRSTVQDGSPELIVVYDRLLLAEHGLTLGEAAEVLRDKVQGVVATRFSVIEESRKIDVMVKIPEEELDDVRKLEAIRVSPADRPLVRLGDVARIAQGRGPSEIRHVGGERVVAITARPRDLDLESAARRARAIAEDLRGEVPERFRGVVVDVSGQSQEAERSRTELLFALALALILVYIVMASQFESLLDPLVIMVSSVFAGVGAVFGLAWSGIPASVVVFIGAIMLAGIVVNNAIVLVDRVNRLQREDGLSRREALVAGARQRLRPILMTTGTTVLGLLPMALARGEGSEMRVPLAVTVISGLVASTVLTLVIVPVVYSLAHAAADIVVPGRRRSASP